MCVDEPVSWPIYLGSSMLNKRNSYWRALTLLRKKTYKGNMQNWHRYELRTHVLNAVSLDYFPWSWAILIRSYVTTRQKKWRLIMPIGKVMLRQISHQNMSNRLALIVTRPSFDCHATKRHGVMRSENRGRISLWLIPWIGARTCGNGRISDRHF